MDSVLQQSLASTARVENFCFIFGGSVFRHRCPSQGLAAPYFGSINIATAGVYRQLLVHHSKHLEGAENLVRAATFHSCQRQADLADNRRAPVFVEASPLIDNPARQIKNMPRRFRQRLGDWHGTYFCARRIRILMPSHPSCRGPWWRRRRRACRRCHSTSPH